MMGYCKDECPNGEIVCCIYCERRSGCDDMCDDVNDYEHAEDCVRYVASKGSEK